MTKRMEKAIKDYLLNQADFNNLYKSKKKNEEVADTFVFIIMNEDISEWSTLFSEYEIRDIKRIMRDYKIMEKEIRDYLLYELEYDNFYKSKKENEQAVETFVDIIINDDKWMTFFYDHSILNEYEIRDIKSIIRDHKINMILNNK